MEKLKIYQINQAELEKCKFATITTDKGIMNVALHASKAPQAVSNFVHLAKSGFYDGLSFHRVISGFVAQGGCPNGDGRGGPGWRIACECDNQGLCHKRGTLSMAHAGRDTGGSQFFICFEAQPHLDGVHTIFGDLEGERSFKVLDKLKQGDKIKSIEIKQSL